MEDYLKRYLEKRNFEKTPEPGGAADAGSALGNVFVVHRHDARNLHFDLRVAHAGRLICWAVPKGFSYDPAIKRLAVHTEDHPLDYLGFEGIIPKGEYGAGSMNVWDAGNYELAGGPDLGAALAKGEVKLKLCGRKLRGEWHLVRLRAKDGAADKDWLLLKGKDKYRDVKWDRLLGMDLSRQPEADPPPRMRPMECGEVAVPFNDYQWGFEPWLEGRRAFCVKDGDRLAFTDGAAALPENALLLDRFAGLKETVDQAVLDGMLVSLNERGVPSRETLKAVLAGQAPGANLYYYAFDLLFFENYDVRGLALRERKALLELAAHPNDRVSFVDYVKTEGIIFALTAREAGLSSIIAKRLDSPYTEGPSDSWKKIDARDFKAGRHAGRTSADVKITHSDKVFFPERNITKGDLIDYYDRISEYLLPFLRDRPLHLYRFPDGIGGNAFYQKHLPDNLPPFLETITLEGKDASDDAGSVYFICNNRESLLYLINLGSIDLHPWFSRKGRLDHPDWIAWDLDPKQAPFSQAVRIAKELGKVLRGIGLAPFIKTSGKSGLHILVSVKPEYTYDQTRMFAESVARIVTGENRSLASVERIVGKRADKVYIDFLQNRRGQTLAPPYAVRPVPAASVSMPLAWEELDGEVDVSTFTVTNALERIAEKGELFRDLFLKREDLAAAVGKLESFYRGKGAAGF